MPSPEFGLPDQVFQQNLDLMKQIGIELKSTDPRDPLKEKVLAGAGDTGTLQTSSDVSTSARLLGPARLLYPGSFSEEDDPRDEQGFIRLQPENIMRGLFEYDPKDGSGDWRYGEPGTPERMGLSILATFLLNGEPIASIIERPLHEQTLTYHHGKIHVIQHGVSTEITPATRRTYDDDIVRYNERRAYPNANLSPAFWEFARNETGVNFQPVRRGGAGDSLSELVLGGLDLVYEAGKLSQDEIELGMVGTNGDWKKWDTDPALKMTEGLGGRLSDRYNRPLLGSFREDLWHRDGVIATAGEKGIFAHEAMVYSLAEYRQPRGRTIPLAT